MGRTRSLRRATKVQVQEKGGLYARNTLSLGVYTERCCSIHSRSQAGLPRIDLCWFHVESIRASQERNS